MNVNEFKQNKSTLKNVETVELAIKEYLETKDINKLLEVKDISEGTDPYGDKNLGYIISTGDTLKITEYFNKTTNFSVLDEKLASFEEDFADLVIKYKNIIPLKEMTSVLSAYIENPKWLDELTDAPSRNFSMNDDTLIKYVKEYGANFIVNVLKKIGVFVHSGKIPVLRDSLKGKLPNNTIDNLIYGFKTYSAVDDLKKLKEEQNKSKELEEKHLQEKIDLAEKQVEEEKVEEEKENENKEFSNMINKLNSIL